MPDQNDTDPQIRIARGDDGPEVEGHIRRPHADHEARPSDPVEGARVHRNDEDEGPDVEGHVFL